MYQYNLGLRFQAVADKAQQQIAIWFGNNNGVGYRQLNELANRLARLMIDRGVGPRDVVCLSGEKSPHTFASILGCLKIGAVYSIFDPDGPVERLCKILSICKPKLLLGGQDLLSKIDKFAAELGTVMIDVASSEVARAINQYDSSNLPQTRRVTGTDPAYIMFTSGSTGFPKGAVMTHVNVFNLIDWSKATFDITSDDILTNVNPLYFDNSVFDFYASLFTGARLVPFQKEEIRDPKRLVEKVDAAGCTLWFSVPSLLIFLQTMKAANGKHLNSIRRFVFGGEGYPKARLKALYDAYADRSDFFNVYGPTECTCICSCYRVTAMDFDDLHGLPPLGQIADNFSYFILNEESKAARDGETGELCLLGPNLGQGYYNDPERTLASFGQNPFNDRFPEVMYRTGDLVCSKADGKLYIQGRRDNQIKHMGYRIELEEIEVALHGLNYIHEAAVLHTSVNGLSRIVAVVSASEELDRERIRMDLKQIIPDYMIPSVFHHHETSLPKSPNGKIDRRYLAEKYLQLEAVKESVGV